MVLDFNSSLVMCEKCMFWLIVKNTCSGWLYFQSCACVPDVVRPLLFLQLNQKFAPLSCHALVLICRTDKIFCCYSENVENRSIVISAVLRDEGKT